jgi:two-component system sensor histidine kinase BaeS
MRLPKLRIAQQLSLLLSSAVVLAVLAVGGLSVWNLQRGFSEYLRQRDDEQLNRLVQVLEQRAAQDPTMEWLRDNRQAMRRLMDEADGRPPPDRRPGPPPELDPSQRPPLDGRPPPPPPQALGNLAQRVLIRDGQGARLAGREAPPGAPVTVRSVTVNGLEVARIEMVLEAKPEGLDARFLKRQYLGLAGAATATILVAMATAWWFGRRWSRPLRAVQAAARRISQGELTVQIPVGEQKGAVHSGAFEIEQLISDVNAMARDLSSLESARRIWIAEISHELRTPLAVLRGEIESIENGARQASKEVMASLADEVRQMTRLVDDLHLLAVADLGQLPCDMVQGDANAALQRIAQRFDGRAHQLGLSIHIDADQQPINATWDFGRIGQLLSNLLENSLRYTQAPGQIRVHWRADSTALTLVVEDSAPGVAPALLPKLFEPLFRVDAARTRTGQHGSGLGLSIVQAIVRAHRGSVAASNSPLGGVAITVRLPIQPQRLERRQRTT